MTEGDWPLLLRWNRDPESLLRKAGLARIRFHDLRHTQGVHPKIVPELLGHTRISTTLDLYSHVTPTMQREAAAALDRILTAPSAS
jgi:integrase